MVRFGIVGTNWITDRFLAAATEVPEFALTAVYSRTEARAREYAAQHGAQAWFTDMKEMAASGDVDAVYVASPNALHREQATLFLEHGRHVLCEKPVASNAREFAAMAETARRRGVVLMEAMKSTLMPNFGAIRAHLDKLGPIRRYAAGYSQYSSRYDALKEGALPNAFNPAFSNGAMMDLGVYGLYPLVVLFGAPTAIKATAVMLDSGVDGAGSILLQYPGMEAVVSFSKINDSALPSEIQGEQASMVIERISQPSRIEIRYRDGRTEDVSVPQSAHTMKYEIEEFIRLIREGRLESETNSHAHSLAVLRIVDEARAQIGLTFPADRQDIV